MTVSQMAFTPRNVKETFEKRAPGLERTQQNLRKYADRIFSLFSEISEKVVLTFHPGPSTWNC